MDSKQQNKGLLTVLGVCVALFFVLMVFSFYTLNLFKNKSSSLKVTKPIGVIRVDGAIFSSKNIIELLHKAEESKTIKAIILQVNSPGGAVGPTQEIYEEIRRIDQLSTKEGGKPIYASFETIAASGGYYLGAATRKIYSNAGTLTGSIGVIMNFMDLSKLYDWAKVNPRVLKAGKYKDIGSTSREMTREERRIMDNMLTKVHQQFKDDILKVRKDRLKKSIDEVAQGQIFSGQEAFEVGLVDSIGGLWKAAREIYTDLELEKEQIEFGVEYIKKEKKVSLFKVFEDLNNVLSNLKPQAIWENINSGHPVLMFK